MSLDSHIWAFDYEEIATHLKDAKYKQEFHYYRQYLGELVWAINTFFDLRHFDIITNVPTSKKHISLRGFDHGEYMGRLLGQKLGLQYEALLEQAYDFSQVNSSIKERKCLPRYLSKKNLSGLHILLIDDVATTRTSLDRCANALKMRGALSVDCATFAYQSSKERLDENFYTKHAN